MTKRESIVKNIFMNTIRVLTTIVFPLITFPYASRVLQAEGMGVISFAQSVIVYFALFAQLGIPTYGVRACAKVRDDKEELTRTVQEIMLLNLITVAIAYIALFLLIPQVPRLHQEKTLYMVLSTQILLNALGMEWLYCGIEKYTYIAIQAVVCKAIATIAMFATVKSSEDYIFYGAFTILASNISNIQNIINLRKYIYFKPVWKYNIKKHIKPIAVFFAMSCATTIYTHMDTVMLGFMAGDIQVGYYTAAVKYKTVLVGIVTSLGVVLLPRASYYVEQGLMQEFRNICRKSLNLVLLVSCPLAGYFILFADPAIKLLCGDGFAGSVVAMRVIMPTLILMGITDVFGIQMLVPIGQEKVVLKSQIVGTAVNIVINALLIPRLLSVGAAIGTVAAEFAVLVVQYLELKKTDFFKTNRKDIAKICIAVAISGVISCATTPPTNNIIIIMFISAGVMFGTYGILLLAMKETMMVEIWRRVWNVIPLKKKNKFKF